MLRTTLQHLCSYDAVEQFNAYHDDKLAEITQKLGITDADLDKETSMHQCVLLSTIFNISPASIRALDMSLKDKNPVAQADRPKEYAVCLLFNTNQTHVLLCRKPNPEFLNKLNGVGGAIDGNETLEQGAIRKIKEDTGITPDQLVNFTKLGTLTLPHDCKTQTDSECILYYFTAAVKDEAPVPQPGNSCLLEWHNVDFVRNTSIRAGEISFAGNGNLQYFVHMAAMYHEKAGTLNAMHQLDKPEAHT